MVHYSLMAVVAACLATPALAGPLGPGYSNIVITSDIPPGNGACVEGQPCWSKPKTVSGPRDKRQRPPSYERPGYETIVDLDCSSERASYCKDRAGSRPPFSPFSDGTYKDKTGEMTGYKQGSTPGNCYEVGKTPLSKDGCYWGHSDSNMQRKFNCPGCRKDFDEVSAQIDAGDDDDECAWYECADCLYAALEKGAGNAKANIAARSESQPTPLNRETSRDTAAIVNDPQFVPVCVVTGLSQKCIAAGNAVCSPGGILDAKDPRCARACNCVRL